MTRKQAIRAARMVEKAGHRFAGYVVEGDTWGVSVIVDPFTTGYPMVIWGMDCIEDITRNEEKEESNEGQEYSQAH